MSDLTREQIEQSLYELQRELAVAKVDADHFFKLSGQYLERAERAEAELADKADPALAKRLLADAKYHKSVYVQFMHEEDFKRMENCLEAAAALGGGK